ncbi:hypothetical protein [Sulfurospirillum cavolei]|uniref:hypothetical protein n=1 Tax=Sulfurospirillum cavolei TaxID=366522 RepID=UPI0005A5DDC4|nr:hypothetical protein [Sulfurospirillum cavolei]
MTKELHQKYLEFFKKNFSYIEIVDFNSIKIRGEYYRIQRCNLHFIADAIIETDHLQTVSFKTILELSKALKTTNSTLLQTFYSVKVKSQKTIDLFIELAKNPNATTEAQFQEELQAAA